MAYMAHVAFKLNGQFTNYDWDKWIIVDSNKGIELRKRMKGGKTLEYVAGMFTDKWEALRYGKQLYVSVFLQLLREDIRIDKAGCNSYYKRTSSIIDGDKKEELPECLFIWKKKHSGGGIGLDIYEADSLDQIDERLPHISIKIHS